MCNQCATTFSKDRQGEWSRRLDSCGSSSVLLGKSFMDIGIASWSGRRPIKSIIKSINLIEYHSIIIIIIILVILNTIIILIISLAILKIIILLIISLVIPKATIIISLVILKTII